jgi:glyoxylase-like metal-dependent hydrolase (beta-lactamase superfamily II)
LRPLLTGVLSGPPGWFERVDGPLAALKAFGLGVRASDRVECPIVAFLLEHPSAGLVLVDTGLHSCIAAGPSEERARNLGTLGRLMARGVSMSPEQSVSAQLAALGIDPADIRLIVMTHMHWDHASALCDFPAATALLSSAEWSAFTGGGQLNGYVAAQLDPRVSYRTIDFGAPPARQFGPFQSTIDLFGDGSLTLLFTPGHSRGHVSLLARLSDRDALIAGDAVYTLATLREGRRPWRSEDPDAFERSVAQLAVWDRENAGALVIPGHDMPAWRTLDPLYR